MTNVRDAVLKRELNLLDVRLKTLRHSIDKIEEMEGLNTAMYKILKQYHFMDIVDVIEENNWDQLNLLLNNSIAKTQKF